MKTVDPAKLDIEVKEEVLCHLNIPRLAVIIYEKIILENNAYRTDKEKEKDFLEWVIKEDPMMRLHHKRSEDPKLYKPNHGNFKPQAPPKGGSELTFECPIHLSDVPWHEYVYLPCEHKMSYLVHQTYY